LSLIGDAYAGQKQFVKALEFYQQALVIHDEVGNLPGKITTLSNMGLTYSATSNPKTLVIFQQALDIAQQVGSLPRKSQALSYLGQAQIQLGKFADAQANLQQALVIAQSIGNRPTQAQALANLGTLLTKQQQPELAIVFYKQSVNTYESIRQNLRTLSQEQQRSYTETVANTYRQLAKLLIEQKRLPEAQAVMELLKLRELRDYTRDAGINSSGISLAKIEGTVLKQLLKQFTTINNFTQTIAQCEQKKCTQLEQLYDQRDRLNSTIKSELNQHRVVLAKHFATEGSIKPEDLNAEARRIVAQPDTVLIYPLVLKDKIQFLLAFKAGDQAVTFRPFETQVNAETLFNTIQTFRQQLGTPGNLKDLQATSQQLHTWLIKPLEAELNQATIKHIVFAPDSITRYIPLAALYDGKQYLVQRYSISTITAASTTDVTEKFPKPSPNQPFLLAMGASVFPTLSPLANVPAELDAIVQTKRSTDNRGIYPGAEFLNQDFNYPALKQNLKNYRILHLATHGKFIPGRPEDSFLVPGRGENLTTQLIETLSDYGLSNIHLVTLSACETAVGDRASDGMEIPGLSHYFLKNKQVKSVLASLWAVNDASTALMMMQFYQKLAQGNITKAEALRQVQFEFIQSKLTAKDAPRRSDEAEILVKGAENSRTPRSSNFSHPYYWAPFILIGNSL
jgi:CHAT domain-containing protein